MSGSEVYSRCMAQAREALASHNTSLIQETQSLAQEVVRKKIIVGKRATQIRGVIRSLRMAQEAAQTAEKNDLEKRLVLTDEMKEKRAQEVALREKYESVLDDAFLSLQNARSALKRVYVRGPIVFAEIQRFLDQSDAKAEAIPNETQWLVSSSLRALGRERDRLQFKPRTLRKAYLGKE